ncbi:secretory phospholipase A2 receptor-like [Choristoneura fumiferana]|uniref:secretory phospholipase A2 receptor-like n=1 Tax=Choristoneura fumiferana TaxID=7141 RepID=UPI003D15CD40
MFRLLSIWVMINAVYFTNAQTFRNDYMWAQAFKTFYRLHDLATNWAQARQICEAEGTNLLVPHSLEEMDNLKLLISNMKAHFTAIFIGVHDQFAHGEYVTLQGYPIRGTILELLWAEGSPNYVNNSENCVVMTREGLFDDRPCDDIYPFVCKILGNETEYSEECYSFDLGYRLNANGKCYKYHSEPLNWHDAYLVCQAEQGHLVIINSVQEASVVTSFLGEHINSRSPDPNILYVGFSDLMFPFQYRTIKGQSLDEAGYSSWSPIKQDLSTTEPQHCGAISRSGFLKVTWCDMPAMFLCEKRGCQECTANLTTPAPAP